MSQEESKEVVNKLTFQRYKELITQQKQLIDEIESQLESMTPVQEKDIVERLVIDYQGTIFEKLGSFPAFEKLCETAIFMKVEKMPNPEEVLAEIEAFKFETRGRNESPVK